MKKKLLVLVVSTIFLAETQFSNAQQAIKLADGSNASNFYYNNGKINIGTLPTVNSHNLSIYRTMQIAAVNASESWDICKLDFLSCAGWPLDTYYGNGFSLQYNPGISSFNILQRVNPGGGQGSLTNILSVNNLGNVGIGTATPANKLSIRKISSLNDLNSNKIQDVLRLSLSVSDGFIPDNVEPRVLFSAQQWGDGGEYNYGAIGAAKENDSNFGRLVFYTGKCSSDGSCNLFERMRLSKDGYLGIGTTTPEYPLDVVGRIRAWGVKINTTKSADFVFEADYKLRPLSEVEAFIKAHKHLPDIQSATQMKKDGLEMGDFQINLLQKIEELTIYSIQLKKENEAQAIVNKDLQQQVLEMKRDMEEMKKMIRK